MSVFAGVEKATVNNGGVYLLAGSYELSINATKLGTTRQGDKFFVAEMTILSSTNPERPAGSKVSWMTMRRFDSFLSNVKGFVCAAMNVPEQEINEEVCNMVVGEDQPLVGQKLQAQAIDTVTKKGAPFTKTQFFAAGSAAIPF